MPDQQTIASPNVVGRRLGIKGAPTPDQLLRITDALLDAQGEVEGFLNRELFAETVVLERQSPRAGYPVTSHRAWDYEQFDDDVEVASVQQTGDDEYTVTFTVGLDGPNTPAITRYVVAAAVESIRSDPDSGMGQRAIKSLSAEGQSVSYDTSPAAGAAGAAPTLDSLRAYKRYGAFRRNRPPRAPWPYQASPVGWDPR